MVCMLSFVGLATPKSLIFFHPLCALFHLDLRTPRTAITTAAATTITTTTAATTSSYEAQSQLNLSSNSAVLSLLVCFFTFFPAFSILSSFHLSFLPLPLFPLFPLTFFSCLPRHTFTLLGVVMYCHVLAVRSGMVLS